MPRKINALRVSRFNKRLQQGLENTRDRDLYRELLADFCEEQGADLLDVAAVLARMAQGDKDLLIKDLPRASKKRSEAVGEQSEKTERKPRRKGGDEVGMERFRIEVGRQHKVGVGNIVGAIANEAGIESDYIGRIQLFDDFSTVDLPAGMPDDVLEMLQSPRVAGQPLKMSRFEGEMPLSPGQKKGRKKPVPGGKGPVKKKVGKAAAKGKTDKARAPRKRAIGSTKSV